MTSPLRPLAEMKKKIVFFLLCLYMGACGGFYLWRTRIPRYFARHGLEYARYEHGWGAAPGESVTNFDWATPTINIVNVDITQSHITSLNGIERLPSLRFFRAHHSPVHDISPLSSLHQLESIDLSYSSVTNLEPLRDLRLLQVLQIQGIPCRSLDGIPTESLKFLDLTLDGPKWTGAERLKRDFSGTLEFYRSGICVPDEFVSPDAAWEFFDRFNGTMSPTSIDNTPKGTVSP